MTFKLNSGQVEAVRRMHDHMDSGPSDPFYVLKGAAGTGKTSCVHTFASEYKGNLIFSAPTNKATGVLRKMNQQIGAGDTPCLTIYSALGLKLGADGAVREVSATGKHKLDKVTAVVVDEGSMIPDKLGDHMRRAAAELNIKFIIMGDPYQLPPVGEDDSHVFSYGNQYELTKVERHDNQILNFVTKIRESIQGNTQLPQMVSDYGDDGGVYYLNRQGFQKQLIKGFTSDSYRDDPQKFRIIAWRNKTVQNYNEIIRDAIYGAKSTDGPFQVGERVVCAAPVIDKDADETLLTTDEETTVQEINVIQHPVLAKFKVYESWLLPDYSTDWVPTYVIHDESRRQWELFLQELADKCKRREASWPEFWSVKEMMHDIRPCHAMTCHRSQGSTFESVFVDHWDILANQNSREAARCLYVGASRASRILVARR